MVDQVRGISAETKPRLAAERYPLDVLDADLEASVSRDGVVTASLVPCRCGGFLAVPVYSLSRLRKRYRKGHIPILTVDGCPACVPGLVDFLPDRVSGSRSESE